VNQAVAQGKARECPIWDGTTARVPWTGGALAEYSLVDSGTSLPLPKGVNPADAASIGVAGVTAY
jgi:NADPH:quinone reductase-like Zn-dependent oxidoreductase